MGQYMRWGYWALLSLAVFGWMLAGAAGLEQRGLLARVAGQEENPIAVAAAFFNAVNTQAYDQVRQLVDPATQFIGDPGTPFERRHDLPGFIEDAQFIQLRLLVARLTLVRPDTVVAEYTIEAQYLPALPHPYTAQATLTIRDGRITGWVSHISAQTLADLTGSQVPGMPRSGYPHRDILPLLLLALGTACATAGYFVQRRTSARVR